MEAVSPDIEGYLIRAFTLDGKGGTLTAVFFPEMELTTDQMFAISCKMKTSHTVFMYGVYSSVPTIIFFTSKGRLLNCAHGIIAAHYLRSQFISGGKGMVQQQTDSGLQKIYIKPTRVGNRIYFAQDLIHFRELTNEMLEALLPCLGLHSQDLCFDRRPVLASSGNFRVLISVKEHVLAGIDPSMDRLYKWSVENNVIGCFIYTLKGKAHDFQCQARMFAPAIGVDEDCINGNSCGCLVAYLYRQQMKPARIARLLMQPFFDTGRVEAFAFRGGESIQTIIGGSAFIEQKIAIAIPKE